MSKRFMISALLLLVAGVVASAGLFIFQHQQRAQPVRQAAQLRNQAQPAQARTSQQNGAGLTSSAIASTQATLPRPDHVVIVMEENHSYADVIGSAAAPYINSLASQGAVFTNSHAVAHPSEPNYLALFSGSTQDLTSDACPLTYSGANLAAGLIGAGDTFGGYSEDLPAVGSTTCYAPNPANALYARKHNPWVDFSDLPSSINMPWTSFPADYSKLPTVSIVVPNQVNDMHSASVQQGDSWLKTNIDGYVQWAKTHNSLLIVTWDEDDGSASNQIPTIFVGPMVKAGTYSESIDHYSVLRTLEDLYKLPYANKSAQATPISDIWR